jgi:hypothetical protein
VSRWWSRGTESAAERAAPQLQQGSSDGEEFPRIVRTRARG